jgi:chloramphenicol O-acetyltransferase type B
LALNFPKLHWIISDDERITVGDFTYGRARCVLYHHTDLVDIGKFCSIGEDTIIFGGGEHHLDWVTTYPLRAAFDDPLAYKDGHPYSKGRTIIGNDVFIGMGSLILSGVTIGDGAVLGARSVVTKDVPPYCVAAGNPARIIRKRFTDDQIQALLEIKWWDWPKEKIIESTSLLCSISIDDFIEQNLPKNS